MTTTFPAVLTGSTITRPADTTAYASGDLVANNTTAASVVPSKCNTGGVDKPRNISRVRLSKSGTSVTNAQFRLHFYNAKPTCANGDNGVWSTDKAANYIGSVDVTIDKAFTDGAAGQAVITGGLAFAPEGLTDNLHILIEARAAYTPASAEVFTPVVEIQ